MLKEIYHPIEDELAEVENVLEASISHGKNRAIGEIAEYLLEPKGKMLRPALVLFSAKASLGPNSKPKQFHLIKIASALELIHIASLVHDDVIDHSKIRHNKPTINTKWGREVSIALGDYLYSVAFELVSECGNPDIIRCISQATKAMCEGELMQVCERDNLALLKQRYIFIVKKKTAALFAACGKIGGLTSNSHKSSQNALREYGLNFGIAFQIVDDYLDLVGKEKEVGKDICRDIETGEMTLPVLNLLDSALLSEREQIKTLLASKKNKARLERIKSKFFNSGADLKTRNSVLTYVALAKDKLGILCDSPYKEGLYALADFVVKRSF